MVIVREAQICNRLGHWALRLAILIATSWFLPSGKRRGELFSLARRITSCVSKLNTAKAEAHGSDIAIVIAWVCDLVAFFAEVSELFFLLIRW